MKKDDNDTDSIEIPNKTPEHILEEELEIAIVDRTIQEYSDVLKDLGKVQAFDFVENMSCCAGIRLYIKIKESKKYKGLPYTDKSGNLNHVHTLEEFCNAFFRRGYRSMQERATQYKLFGEQFYESAHEVGVPLAGFRQLQKLPDNEIDAAKELLQIEGKDALIDFVEDMTTKHSKEKEALQKQAEKLERENRTNLTLLDEQTEKANKLDRDLSKKRLSNPPWDEQAKETCLAISKVAMSVIENVSAMTSLIETINMLSMDGGGEKAVEHAACAFYHDATRIGENVAQLLHDRDDAFGAYKDRARPTQDILFELSPKQDQE